jgi:hypothetical protein
MSTTMRCATISVSADFKGNRVLLDRAFDDGEHVMEFIEPKQAALLAQNIISGLNNLLDARRQRQAIS